MSHGKANRRARRSLALRALTHQALGLPLLMAVLALAAALLLPALHTLSGLPAKRPAATISLSDRQTFACRDLVVNNRRFSGGQN